MKVRNKIITYNTITLLLYTLSGSYYITAQQDSQYTQYMYNTISINPAYAGSRDVLSFKGLYRSQWVGLDGAPETMTFSVDSPLSDQVGLGVSFYSDRIGPADESFLALDFSYTIPLGNQTSLSFGLKGGANLLNVDFTRLNIFDDGDQDFANNIENRISPTIGLGLYLTDTDRWYIGLSTPNMLKTDHYDDVVTSTATERMNLYLIGGYVFDLNQAIELKPAVLFKAVKGAPIAIDLSANFRFYERFTLGVGYRLDAAISGLAGLQINDSVLVGYAYDYDITDLGNYNSGSHELLLRFELGTKVRKSVNPRFF